MAESELQEKLDPGTMRRLRHLQSEEHPPRQKLMMLLRGAFPHLPFGSENNVDPFELSSIGQTFVYEIIYKIEFPFINSTQSLCRQIFQKF